MAATSESRPVLRSTERRPADLPRLTLPQHGLTRYVHTRVEMVDRVLGIDAPRTLLGIVPMGTRRVEVPLADLVSLEVRGFGRRIRVVRLLVGLSLVIGGPVLTPWWIAGPLVLLGLWIALVSLGPKLEVVTRAGVTHRVPVCSSHQLDADLFIRAVEDLMSAARVDDLAGQA